MSDGMVVCDQCNTGFAGGLAYKNHECPPSAGSQIGDALSDTSWAFVSGICIGAALALTAVAVGVAIG